MADRSKKKQSTRAHLQDFVTVAFAEDMELAKQYKKMLKESEIPAVIKVPSDSSAFPGIAVMVPEDDLDEAHVMIESQGANDSFYDLAFKDDEYEDLDEEFDHDDDRDETFYENDI